MNNAITQKRDDKARVMLLVGFLGAGKTTLLKHILSWKADMSDTVVIVNELGDIGIDGSLLQGEESDIIELTSGCICCTLIVDLKVLLKRIWERFNPQWLFIEASGVADPASLNSLFHEDEIKQHTEFFQIITILDAECWEMREIMGQLFHRQLNAADLILLNKIDLLDTDKVKRCIKEVREALPQAKVLPTMHCRIDPESVSWEVRQDELDWAEVQSFAESLPQGSIKGTDLNHDSHEHAHEQVDGDHASEADFVAFSFQDSKPLDEACFKRFIEELPFEVFRVKGTVRLPDRTVLVNFVGGRSEWTDCDYPADTRLAFVGWEIEADETLCKLKECVRD